MNGMLIWRSVLVGLQVLSGGAILGDVLPDKWVALFILATSAAQAGTVFYQRERPTINAKGLS